MITYQVEQFHIFYLLWGWLWLYFLFSSRFLVAFVPFSFEFLLADQFVIFNTNIGAVNWSVPLDLDFLIDFAHIPLESLFIEALNVGGDEGLKEKGDLILLCFGIGKELHRTVEDATVVKSGNGK